MSELGGGPGALEALLRSFAKEPQRYGFRIHGVDIIHRAFNAANVTRLLSFGMTLEMPASVPKNHTRPRFACHGDMVGGDGLEPPTLSV